MEIPLDYYKTFYYVAKHSSLTRAAEALTRGQPNITKTIQNLEDQLGCKLFVRKARGVRLTPEGEKLYGHIAAAMGQIQAGEQEIQMDRSLQSGVVRIASGEIALRCCLMPVLERFRGAYPHVRIRLSNCSYPQAMEILKNGQADFAVVTAPSMVPDFLEVRKILGIREVPVCAEAFSQLWNREVTLGELAEYPLICMEPKTTTFQALYSFFAQEGVPLEPDIEVATADQILPLVKSNLGIGFVPELFLEPEESGRSVRRLKLEPPVPERPVCLLKRRDSSLSIAAAELERMLTEYPA